MNSVDNTDYIKSKNIRILSYNVFLRPPGISSYFRSEGDLKDERTREITNIIKDYDIVMFQELFNISLFGFNFISNRLKIMIEIGKKMGFKYYVSPIETPYFNISLVNSGLLILSKYPIFESDSLNYDHGYGFDMMSKKGVLYAKIMIIIENSAIPLHIFNTHAQSGDLYEETVVRWKQLQQLINFIYKKIPENETAIIGGDFNLDSINNALFSKTDKTVLLKGTDESKEYKIFCDMLSGSKKGIKREIIDCLAKLHKSRDTQLEDALLFDSASKKSDGKEHFMYNLPFFSRQRKQYNKQLQYIKKHPVTIFGHTEIGVYSDSETEPSDILRSLDYIFLLPPLNKNVKIELIEAKPKPYLNIPKAIKFINNMLPRFLTLSDHYAIETEIKISIVSEENKTSDIIDYKEPFETNNNSNIIFDMITIILLIIKAVIVFLTLLIWHIPYKIYLFMLFVLIYYYF